MGVGQIEPPDIIEEVEVKGAFVGTIDGVIILADSEGRGSLVVIVGRFALVEVIIGMVGVKDDVVIEVLLIKRVTVFSWSGQAGAEVFDGAGAGAGAGAVDVETAIE